MGLRIDRIVLFGSLRPALDGSEISVSCDFPGCERSTYVPAAADDDAMELLSLLPENHEVHVHYMCASHGQGMAIQPTAVIGVAAVRYELSQMKPTPIQPPIEF